MAEVEKWQFDLREIFNDCQKLDLQTKLLKKVLKLYRQQIQIEKTVLQNGNRGGKQKKKEHHPFFDELTRILGILLRNDYKSPYVKNVIAFVAKFLTEVHRLEVEPLEQENNPEPAPQPEEPPKANRKTKARKAKNDDESQSDQENDDIGMYAFGRDSFGGQEQGNKKKKDKKTGKGKKTTVQETAEEEPEPTLLERLIEDFMVQSLQDGDINVRINCCNLIYSMLPRIDSFSEFTYNTIRDTLLDQLKINNPYIRKAAVGALYRFQHDSDKNVIKELKFHVKADPDTHVKLACLNTLTISKETLPLFVHVTRLNRDILRKMAYTKLVNIHMQSLTIEQRLQVLRTGLKDRNKHVQNVVKNKLIPTWFRAMDFDLKNMLVALDIMSDVELVNEMLEILFTHLLKEPNSDTKTKDKFPTKFHLELQKFGQNYLDENNVLKEINPDPETCYLWHSLIKFCVKNEEKLAIRSVKRSSLLDDEDLPPPLPASAQSNDEVEGEVEPTPQAEDIDFDPIDVIRPDLPQMCIYIQNFINRATTASLDYDEEFNVEFCYKELVDTLSCYQIGDSAQMKILSTLLDRCLRTQGLREKFEDHINCVIRVLATKVFPKNEELLNYIVGFINEIEERISNGDSTEEESDQIDRNKAEKRPHVSDSEDELIEKRVEVQEDAPLTADEIRQLESQYAKLTIELSDKTDELDEAVKKKDYKRAQLLQEQIDRLNDERAQIRSKRLNRVVSQRNDPPPAMNYEDDDIQEILDADDEDGIEELETRPSKPSSAFDMHPEELLICLELLKGCLCYGDFKEVGPILLQQFDRLCVPGILNTEAQIRKLGVCVMGLYCLIDSKLAKRNFPLLLQIIHNDVELVRVAAVKSLFDSLVVHGLINFCSSETEDKQKNKQKTDLNTSGSSTSTLVPNDDSDLIESQKNPEERKEEFIKLLSDHLVELLSGQSGGVRLVAVQGIAKLMIHGRIFSPMLLGKMIILWYHPETESNVRQFIGTFLPVYAAYKQSRSGLSDTGQNAFEEIFIEILEEVYAKKHIECEPEFDSINIDNMIDFMFNLMTEETQAKVALAIAHRALMYPDDNDFGHRYLIRALERLSPAEATLSQVRELINILGKIKEKYEELEDIVPQTYIKRVSKLVEKFNDLKRHLKETHACDPDVTLVESVGDEDKENEQNGSRSSSGMDQNGDIEENDDQDTDVDADAVVENSKSKKGDDAVSDAASDHSVETDDPNQALSSDEDEGY